VVWCILYFKKNLTTQIQPNVDQCRMENQHPDTRAKPLTLVDMTSCFIVLSFGYSISMLVFLLELIYDKIRNYCFSRHPKLAEVRPFSNTHVSVVA
jgi:hypothetical protein